MEQYNACDAHKKYSIFGGILENGKRLQQVRVGHDRRIYGSFLKTLPAGSSIALESMGSWYWMVDEIEKAGHQAVLVHPRKAKLMMGQINKTDKLDVNGLATLHRNGTLPEVWIAPGEIRDQRELPRMRMVFVSMRTKLKNRIHATLAKYNIQIEAVSDVFGVEGRKQMQERFKELPPETKRSAEEQLKLLEDVEERIETAEKRIGQIVRETPEMQLLKTLHGFGPILSIVVALEIGKIERFGRPEQLAAYSGTVPRIHSSGGKTRFGKTCPDVNRYLKHAFIEAANVIVMNQERMAGTHVVTLYQRLRHAKGHGKAVVAVARHLAEAAYWVLTKKEVYREPLRKKLVSSTHS